MKTLHVGGTEFRLTDEEYKKIWAVLSGSILRECEGGEIK